MLAALTLSAPRPLTIPELTERVWGAEWPESAASVLYGHLSRLRSMLRDCAGAVTLEGGRTRGYVLKVQQDDVDLFALRALLEQARARSDNGDLDGALALWRRACDLWDGSFLEGLSGHWVDRTRRSVRTEYIAMLSGRYRAELAAGDHSAIVAPLSALAARMPHAEQLVAQLMLALYRDGRPAEALDWYANTRRHLGEDLGVEPGAELRAMHQRILQEDPALSTRREDGARPRATVPPAQLPADTVVFSGRGEQLAQLYAGANLAAANGSLAPTVSVVHGMAGVGKTALAVHAAWRLTDLFPDGQIFLDLHGFTPGAAPVHPSDALDRILRHLGVAASEVPEGVEDRAALYRSLLRGKRYLIVFDNAADEQQVRLLLPSHSGSYTMVTSRRVLLALDDALEVPLDPLPADQAVELFLEVSRLEPEHRREERDIVAAVECCGYLPLAIRIAATRLRSRPHWTLETLLLRLRDERQRLPMLHAGERRVATAFDASYRSLTDGEQYLYRLLGLLPGVSFTTHVASALMDAPISEVDELLGSLSDASLVVCEPGPRYRLYDLLRLYAERLAEQELHEAARNSARQRLCDMYRTASHRATALLDPFSRTEAPPVSLYAPEFPDRASAHSWWQQEWRNVRASLSVAERQGLDEHVVLVAKSMWTFLDSQRYVAEAVDVATTGIAASRRLGDTSWEALLLNQRGAVRMSSAEYTDALNDYLSALSIRQQIGDVRDVAGVLNNIGIIFTRMGRFRESTQSYRQALELGVEKIGEDLAALLRVNLVSPLLRLGEASDVLSHLDSAAATFERLGHEIDLARVAFQRGELARLSGDYRTALDCHRQALATASRQAQPYGRGLALNAMANDLRDMGRLARADSKQREALSVARTISDKQLETEILRDHGRTLQALDRPDEAIAAFRESARIADAIRNVDHRARALHGLADVLTHVGRVTEAWTAYREAHMLYLQCEVPESTVNLSMS